MMYSVDDVISLVRVDGWCVLHTFTLALKALSNVAWEVMTTALRHLALCSGIYGEIPEDSIEA